MSRSPCCSKEGLNRGAWTKEEDTILSNYIRVHGDGRWRNLPKKAGEFQQISINGGGGFVLRVTTGVELIIRMHRLLGNRYLWGKKGIIVLHVKPLSVEKNNYDINASGRRRLPGRTDNEIKNTRLKKKMHNLRIRPGSPPRLQDGVFKATPMEITAVRHREMVTPNCCSDTGSSDNTLKLSNIQETRNSFKSWSGLFVNNSIPEDDSERMQAFRMEDATLVETEARQQFLHSYPFAENAGFGLEDFFSGSATLDAQTNDQFEYQSNMQGVNSFALADEGVLR